VTESATQTGSSVKARRAARPQFPTIAGRRSAECGTSERRRLKPLGMSRYLKRIEALRYVIILHELGHCLAGAMKDLQPQEVIVGEPDHIFALRVAEKRNPVPTRGRFPRTRTTRRTVSRGPRRRTCYAVARFDPYLRALTGKPNQNYVQEIVFIAMSGVALELLHKGKALTLESVRQALRSYDNRADARQFCDAMRVAVQAKKPIEDQELRALLRALSNVVQLTLPALREAARSTVAYGRTQRAPFAIPHSILVAALRY
jgi:hypothetical protein